MKRLTDRKRITLMIIFIALSLGTYAQVRDFHRLSSLTYYFGTDDSGGTHGNMTYHYDPQNPALLLSQIHNYVGYGGDEYTQEITCVSTSETLPEGTRIYTEYSIDAVLEQKVTNVIDQSGRFIYHLVRTQNNGSWFNSKEIFRHYNSFGYADSILVQTCPGMGSPIAKQYIVRSFAGESLTHSILYRLTPSMWMPIEKYSFSYSQNPIVLPGFIRFDTVESQQQQHSFYTTENSFNPRVIPDSIVCSIWSQGAWVPSQTISAFQYFEDGQVILERDWSNASSLFSCSLNGNIEQYESSSYDEDGGSYRGASFSWYPLPVDDESYAPPAPEPLKLYPNPFSDRLNIALEAKTGPAEISIYNTRGQLIRCWNQTDIKNLIWDGKDSSGKEAPQGLYFIKIRIMDQTYTSKAIRMN